MTGGRYSMLIVAYGRGDDPQNDPSVKVGIYDSLDAVVMMAWSIWRRRRQAASTLSYYKRGFNVQLKD